MYVCYLVPIRELVGRVMGGSCRIRPNFIFRIDECAHMLRMFWGTLGLAVVVTLSGCSSSPSLPVSVSLTPSSPQAVDQGLGLLVGIQATVANDKDMKGVTWSLSGPGSLTATTGSSVAYVTPTASIASPVQATVTATSVVDPTKTASVPVTVNPLPRITTLTLPAGTVGAPYSTHLDLLGGTAPFTWSVYDGAILTGNGIGGSLPDGVTLDASTGAISGTPTAAGTWYFEGTVSDADDAGAVDGFLKIQINPAGAVAGNPVPFLNQPLVPSAVAPGGSGFTLSVSGSGFTSEAVVDFNGKPLATTFVDGEHLSALVPATDVATSGTASVTVVNPTPGGGASNVAFFQVGAQETAVSFINAANSPLQIQAASYLAVADFNQDGKPDLVVAKSFDLDVLLSNGDGTFNVGPGSPVAMPSPPYDNFASPYAGAMAVGDFNHSGHAGLAVIEFPNEAAVILLGDGSGKLKLSSSAFAYAPGEPTSGIGAADFNADGNLDLAITNTISGYSTLDLGYGAGAFNMAGEIPNGTSDAIGDFNGDGKLDVAVAENIGIAVAIGNGDGTFPKIDVPIQNGYELFSLVAGDFDGDGKLDLAGTNYGGNAVLFFSGNGDGTFKTPVSIATGNSPDAIVMGDFNNDGKLDIVTANYGDGTVTLLLGKGDGTFAEATGSPYAVGKGPSSVLAADFNGDGKLDLAVANGLDATGTVSILLQQ
jgi:hypothetical protein